MLIDFHRRMLADRVRHDAYRAALAHHIGRGARTVADIGAGTGVLSFFARELGATECWPYEPGAVLGLAEAIAARNGIDGLHFVPQHSLAVEDPVAVDLVVAEVFGNFALEEGVLDTLADAHRFLGPGGALCPAGLLDPERRSRRRSGERSGDADLLRVALDGWGRHRRRRRCSRTVTC